MTLLEIFLWLLSSKSLPLEGDIRDKARFLGDRDAQAVCSSFSDHTASFFPEGVSFSIEGVSFPEIGRRFPVERVKHVLQNIVLGVELHGDIVTSTYSYNGVLLERVFSYPELEVLEEYPFPLDTTIEVGLVARKLVIRAGDLVKVYPIGDGAFDFTEHPYRLMTKEFGDAWLDISRAKFAENAHGYHERPFMPITDRISGETWYSFHVVQHSDEAPDPTSKTGYRTDFNFLRRGFDSHGCMRLRDRDLYELYLILSVTGKIPLHTSLWGIGGVGDHPYPLDNTKFQQVKNFGSVYHPITMPAPAGYRITKGGVGFPPFWLLGQSSSLPQSSSSSSSSAYE